MIFLQSVGDIIKPDSPDVLDGYIKEIAKEDTGALARLYESTKAAVYGFALSVLKNTHDAEDVLHDLYINVYSSAAGYKSKGKPLAWMLTITRNLCLLKLRERKKTSDIPMEDWEKAISENDSMSFSDKMVIFEVMKALTDEERQIILLHAVAGFKHREIAEILDLALPTVLSKYQRSLKKLKKLITEGDGAHE